MPEWPILTLPSPGDIGQRDKPLHCIGASVPRSGHGFLRRLLQAYFGKGMAFCNTYNPERCCGRLPCDRSRDSIVFYQKNHDFDFSVDENIWASWALYVVQHRHPLPQILSHSELREVNSGTKFSTEQYITWLARQVLYRKRFTHKWITPARSNTLLLRYEDLTADPLSTVGEVIKRATGAVDEGRFAAALAHVGEYRGAGELYRPREIAASQHFDEELHGSFEALVLSECPSLGYEPMLGRGGSVEDSPLAMAYRKLSQHAET